MRKEMVVGQLLVDEESVRSMFQAVISIFFSISLWRHLIETKYHITYVLFSLCKFISFHQLQHMWILFNPKSIMMCKCKYEHKWEFSTTFMFKRASDIGLIAVQTLVINISTRVCVRVWMVGHRYWWAMSIVPCSCNQVLCLLGGQMGCF